MRFCVVSPSRLYPRYVVPTVVKDPHAHMRELVKRIKQEATVISLTSDSWSSRANTSFNTVICHFIAKEWTFPSAVL